MIFKSLFLLKLFMEILILTEVLGLRISFENTHLPLTLHLSSCHATFPQQTSEGLKEVPAQTLREETPLHNNYWAAVQNMPYSRHFSSYVNASAQQH